MGKNFVRGDINKAIDDKEGLDVWDKALQVGAPAIGAVLGGAAMRRAMRKSVGEEYENWKDVRPGEEVYDQFGGTHRASKAEADGYSNGFRRKVNFAGRMGALAGGNAGGLAGSVVGNELMRSRQKKSRRK